MYYTDSDGRSYPALKRVRMVGGEKVVTWERQVTDAQVTGARVTDARVTDATVLTIEAGTNGYHGYGTGHGCGTDHGCRTDHSRHADHACRTFLRISDSACTNIQCDVEEGYSGNAEEITITLDGDAELRMIIEALKWMASILETQIMEVQILEVQSEVMNI